jgi:very-short-patch-repair endonuclease
LLVIEVDGVSHEDKTNYDMTRDLYLGKMCIKTIKYDDGFLKANPDMMYDDILKKIEQRKGEVVEKMICDPMLNS